MRSEKEAMFIKTILYADVLAMAVQNMTEIPPAVSGALKAYLDCREVNGHAQASTYVDGIQYKNGIN